MPAQGMAARFRASSVGQWLPADAFSIQPQQLGGFARIASLPFTTHFPQATDTDIEIVAKPLEHFVLGVIVRCGNGTGDTISTLAMIAVLDQIILPVGAAQPQQCFGIDTRPEE